MNSLTELRELADMATPGPWTVNEDRGDRMVLTAADDRWVANVGNWSRQTAAYFPDEVSPRSETLLHNVFDLDEADARYIAACSPEVIKALVAAAQVVEYARDLGEDCCHSGRCYVCRSWDGHESDCPLPTYDALKEVLK